MIELVTKACQSPLAKENGMLQCTIGGDLRKRRLQVEYDIVDAVVAVRPEPEQSFHLKITMVV